MEVTKVCILWTYDENDSKDQPIVAFCRAMGDYVWLARVASVFKNIWGKYVQNVLIFLTG